jgi:hypothetical protein
LITTKDENPEAGRKRESPKKDEGRRRLFTDQIYLQISHHDPGSPPRMKTLKQGASGEDEGYLQIR